MLTGASVSILLCRERESMKRAHTEIPLERFSLRYSEQLDPPAEKKLEPLSIIIICLLRFL